MSTHELTINRSVNAPRSEVFKAFTDKKELEKWFCPEGMTVTINKLELKEGGTYKLTMKDNKTGAEHIAEGTYKEVSDPEKLVFTWQWTTPGMGGDETLVTVLLKENGGGTDLTFTHGGFAEAKQKDMHNQGWTSAFNQFDKLFG